MTVLTKEFVRAIRNHKYEKTDEGILFPKAEALLGGVFTFEVFREGDSLGVEYATNIVVDEGLNYLLDAALSGGTPITSWYVGIYGNNYTPVAGDLGSNIATNAGEITTQYDEATRPAWSDGGVASELVDNSASPATFTFNTTDVVYGAFLVGNDNVKGGATGTLYAAALFATSRDVASADVGNITYACTIADA